jgi:hypothetical protein
MVRKFYYAVGFAYSITLVASALYLSKSLLMERATMKAKAVHLSMVVASCRYFVFVTLKNAKGPSKQTKHAT